MTIQEKGGNLKDLQNVTSGWQLRGSLQNPTLQKKYFLIQYFCLIFQYKSLNIIKLRYIYLICKMT